jgi:hypothetical protein
MRAISNMKLSCCLTCLLLLRLSVFADMELRNGIMAIANESIITAQDVEIASAQVVESARRAYGVGSPQFRQKWNDARNDAVNNWSSASLFRPFNTGGRVLPESIIDDSIQGHHPHSHGNRVNLTKNLQAENTTFGHRQKTRDDLILRIMDAHNVREHILISPAKTAARHETNLHRYKLSDQGEAARHCAQTRLSSADDIRTPSAKFSPRS